MSKSFVLATAVILSLATGRAFADSDGNPFPFAAPPQVTTGQAFVVATGSEQYPLATGNTVQASTLTQLEPAYGQEGIVQTARSLPRGSAGGVVATAGAPKGGKLEAGVAGPAG